MTSAIVELTYGTDPTTPSGGLIDIFGASTKVLGVIDDAGNKIKMPVIRENETVAVQPQYTSVTNAAPTGNISTVAKMMGLGSTWLLTPQITGRMLLLCSGIVLNSTAAGDGTTVTMKFGTGAAPSNGGSSVGTIVGLAQHFIASTTAGQQGFTCMGVVTAQTLNVALWFDLEVIAVTGGGSTVKDVQMLVMEF